MDGHNVVGGGEAEAAGQQRLQAEAGEDHGQPGDEAEEEATPGLQLDSGHGAGGHPARQQAALQQLKVQRCVAQAGADKEEAGGRGDGRALDEAGVEDGQLDGVARGAEAVDDEGGEGEEEGAGEGDGGGGVALLLVPYIYRQRGQEVMLYHLFESGLVWWKATVYLGPGTTCHGRE